MHPHGLDPFSCLPSAQLLSLRVKAQLTAQHLSPMGHGSCRGQDLSLPGPLGAEDSSFGSPCLPLVGFSQEFPLNHSCNTGHCDTWNSALVHLGRGFQFPEVLECRWVSGLPQRAHYVHKWVWNNCSGLGEGGQ